MSTFDPAVFQADAFQSESGAATVTDSVAADAVVAATIGGSFSANTVALTTVAGSFGAYALIVSTRSGSFTTDAFALGWFTADAVVYDGAQTVDGSFTANAAFFKTVTGSLSADAVLLAGASGQFAADGITETTGSGSATADAWISKTQTSAFTANAIQLATITGSRTADAIVRIQRTGSLSADAIVKRTYPSGTKPAYAAQNSNYGSASSLTVTKPTGTTIGDTLIAAISFDATNNESVTVLPPDETWSQVVLLMIPGGDHGLVIWKKTAIASEPSSYTFTPSPAGARHMAVSVIRVTGNPNEIQALTRLTSTYSAYYHYIPSLNSPDNIVITAPSLTLFFAAAPIYTTWSGTSTEIVDTSSTYASLRVSYRNYYAPAVEDYYYAYSSYGAAPDVLAVLKLSAYVMPTADAVIFRADMPGSFTLDAEIVPRHFHADARLKLVGGNAFYAEAYFVVAPTTQTDSFSGSAITKRTTGIEAYDAVGSEPFDRVVADSWGTGPFGTWAYADTGVFSVDSSYGLINNAADPTQTYYAYNEVELPDIVTEGTLVTITSRYQWPTLPAYGGNSAAYYAIEVYAYPDWWNSVTADLTYSHQVEPAQAIFHLGYYDAAEDWQSSNSQVALPSAGDWYYLKIKIDIENQAAAAKFWEEGQSEPDWLLSGTNLGVADFGTMPWYLSVYGRNAEGEGLAFGGIGTWKIDYIDYSARVTPEGVLADALLFKTTQGSLAADAWLQVSSGTMTWGGEWTANAQLLLGTPTASFTASASIRKPKSGQIYLNSVIFKPATIRYGFFLTAAWVIGTVASFTADAQIADPATATDSFTYEFSTSDTYRLASFTANAIVATSSTTALFADAYLGRFFRADAFFVGTTFTTTADATLWKTMSGSFTANAAVGYSYVSDSFTADAWLMGTVAWFRADAVIFDGLDLTGSFTADAVIYTLSFTADAFIPGWFTANAYIREETTLWFDEDGSPSPRYPKQRRVEIFLRQQGVITDITEHVVFAESQFTQHARTAPGTFTCVLRGEFTEWEGGEDIWVDIDGARQFGGLVLQVTYGYWFGDVAEPRTTLSGADYNIYLDRLILWNKSTTSPYYKPPPTYPKNSSDRAIIRDACRDLTNLPSGFDYDTYVDIVDSTLNEDEKWMVNTGQTLRAFMTEISKITNAIWWIDQYLNLHYHTRSFVTAPYPITDGKGGISCQNLKYTTDASSMINDVFVYGTLSATTEGEIYLARRENDDAIEKYGRRQYSEIRSDLHTTRHVNKRANSIRSRRSIPIVTAEMDIFESGFFAGQVVELKLNAYDVEKTLVIRESTLSFPVIEGRIDGKFYGTPKYGLKLGLEPDDPWNIYDMLPWDMPDWPPFPAWDAQGLIKLTDATCPIGSVSGGVGGQMDIGWSSSSPASGTRPWNLYGTDWDEEPFTPAVYEEYPYSGAAYVSSSGIKFRFGGMTPPCEVLVEFHLDALSGRYNDSYAGLRVAIGSSDPVLFSELFRIFPSGKIYYALLPTGSSYNILLGQVDPIQPGERMLLRFLNVGERVFVKLWRRDESEPSEWTGSFTWAGTLGTAPYAVGGDYVSLSSYSSSGYVFLSGITGYSGFTSIPEQQVAGVGAVSVVINPYMGGLTWTGGGFDYSYTWAAPADADLEDMGNPWIGWVNATPVYSWTVANNGVPTWQAFCEFKDFTGPDQPGLVKEINQDAAGINIPLRNGTEWPISIKIKGEIVRTPGGYNNVSGIGTTFGVGTNHNTGVPTPSWHGAGGAIGTLFAPTGNGGWNVPHTNWLPFEYEIAPNQALMTIPPGGTKPRFYVWCWAGIEAEGSALSSYIGYMDAFAAGAGNWTSISIQKFTVEFKYAPPVSYYREEPVHFCMPASEGSTIEVNDGDDPIWGWFTEAVAVTNGSFSSRFPVVRGLFTVWHDGQKLLPNQDWTANSSTSFTLSTDYVNQHHPILVTLTYLIDSPGIPIAWEPSRSTTRTDVRLDGKYPPGVRGID